MSHGHKYTFIMEDKRQRMSLTPMCHIPSVLNLHLAFSFPQDSLFSQACLSFSVSQWYPFALNMPGTAHLWWKGFAEKERGNVPSSSAAARRADRTIKTVSSKVISNKARTLQKFPNIVSSLKQEECQRHFRGLSLCPTSYYWNDVMFYLICGHWSLCLEQNSFCWKLLDWENGSLDHARQGCGAVEILM